VKHVALVAALGAALASAPAEARITAIVVNRVEPFADGASFGKVGAYERVIGMAKGELDPEDPLNRGIVDLAKAKRNARGTVEYEVDLFLLRPKDPAKGSGTILYEVNNRGRKLLLPFLMDARESGSDPKSLADAGDGLAFRRGYTIVWSGWDADAPHANFGLAMRVPVIAKTRTIRDELVSGTRGPLVQSFSLRYVAASLDTHQARLTFRRKEADPAATVPADRWAFIDERSIRLLPAGSNPEPGALYELYYRAKDPEVLGIGFAATRDLVDFLRHDQSPGNPAGPGIGTALAFGISQSGRYLRDFIGQGFNQAEAHRQVFDGVLTHISGVGRVFLNAEYGQPSRTNTQHEDHLMPENEFPFSTAALSDPVTGRKGSLFRHDGFDPLLIEVNTSTEYWQKGASLLTTDPLGRRDVALPDNARVFMIAGTEHAGHFGLTPAAGHCVNPRNPHDPSPALRALLVDLDAWVHGTPAPPSRVPRIADGSLVAADRIGFPAIPDFVGNPAATNAIARFRDWVHPKPEGGKQYVALVAKVGADGNESAGVRLPDIAAPIATYTGWNAYKAPFPEGEMCDRDGSYAPFARTKAERLATGDPRPSLEELYGSEERYLAAVTAAADALVKDRLLLPEDAERYVAAAKAEKSLAAP